MSEAEGDRIRTFLMYAQDCKGMGHITRTRSTHKIEQQIRAERLAALGLVHWVHPSHLSGERLAGAVEWALGRDPREHARLVRTIIPALDGAARHTEYVAQVLESNHTDDRGSVEGPWLVGQRA